MLLFIGFAIYFFGNGNVDIYHCPHCKGWEGFGESITRMMILAGTIAIYSIIYLFSLRKYSSKYSIASCISVLLFLFGISDMKHNTSMKNIHKQNIADQKSRIQDLSLNPGLYSLKETSKSLAKLGDYTEKPDYYHQAITKINQAIEQDKWNYELYKSKSEIYEDLATLTDDINYYKNSINSLVEFYELIQERDAYKRIKIKVLKDIDKIYVKWSMESENLEDLLMIMAYLEKGESKPSYDKAKLYEKLFEFTADSSYLYKAIKGFTKSQHYIRVADIYGKLKNYPKAIEIYKREISKSNAYTARKRKLEKELRQLQRKLKKQNK